MTKVNSKQLTWLDLQICRDIYETFKLEYAQNNEEPLPEFDARYPGKLESILESVRLRYGQFSKIAYLHQISVAYFVSLTKSQALVNGNKRMGVLFTTVFLYVNGYDLGLSEKELAKLSLLVAKSKEKLPKVVELLEPVFEKNLKKRTSLRVTLAQIITDSINRLGLNRTLAIPASTKARDR